LPFGGRPRLRPVTEIPPPLGNSGIFRFRPPSKLALEMRHLAQGLLQLCPQPHAFRAPHRRRLDKPGLGLPPREHMRVFRPMPFPTKPAFRDFHLPNPNGTKAKRAKHWACGPCGLAWSWLDSLADRLIARFPVPIEHGKTAPETGQNVPNQNPVE
jgi:hypothetical protein